MSSSLTGLVALLLQLAGVAQNMTVSAPGAAPAPAPAPQPGPPAYMFPVIYAETNRGLRPERLKAYGQQHYYQLLPAEQARGTVVFLHGCARLARAFFPYDPERCPECLGFPEHVSHVKQALALGYSVLALDPNDAAHNCWSSSTRGRNVNDQPDVIETVSEFLKEHGLAGKPLYLWGASSGGTLALKLPATLAALRAAAEAEGKEYRHRLEVAGIISEVASPEDFGAFDEQGRLLVEGYPPTAFVRMAGDGSDESSRANVRRFQQAGIPSGVITSPVRQVGPTFFSDRSPVISREQSLRIVAGLRAIGMLDGEGHVTADPSVEDNPALASYGWSVRLKQLLPWLSVESPTLSLLLRTSGIRQSLYVAYARHDAVSDWFTACMKFLESRGQQPLEALIPRYAVRGGRLAALAAFPPARAPAPAPAPAAQQ